MEIIETGLEGLVEIQPRVFKDKRGYFLETFRQDVLEDYGLNANFVQDNQSFSQKGVVRGLHMQKAPFAQIKLVRCVTGKVLDVVVDLRRGSKTFGEKYQVVLDAEKQNMLYVPEGFAHGIGVLEDTTLSYKCSNYYNKEAEVGVKYNDSTLSINWMVDSPIVSQKDETLPTLDEYRKQNGL